MVHVFEMSRRVSKGKQATLEQRFSENNPVVWLILEVFAI